MTRTDATDPVGSPLAERVAAAADAWLRDPQDAKVYGRLVAATLAWRAADRPPIATCAASSASEPHDADDGAPAAEPDPVVTLPPRLGDALGDVVAGLQRRQRPHDDPGTPGR